MRNYPVDGSRLRLMSTGNLTAVQAWVELADKSRKPDPNGRQDEDEQGRPLWVVEAITPADPDDPRDKTGVIEIRVASHDRPDVGQFGQLLDCAGLPCPRATWTGRPAG